MNDIYFLLIAVAFWTGQFKTFFDYMDNYEVVCKRVPNTKIHLAIYYIRLNTPPDFPRY